MATSFSKLTEQGPKRKYQIVATERSWLWKQLCRKLVRSSSAGLWGDPETTNPCNSPTPPSDNNLFSQKHVFVFFMDSCVLIAPVGRFVSAVQITNQRTVAWHDRTEYIAKLFIQTSHHMGPRVKLLINAYIKIGKIKSRLAIIFNFVNNQVIARIRI